MRKYTKPTIKVKHVEPESILASSTEDSPSINSVIGLPENTTPSIGGLNDGSHSVGAKTSTWSSWDEEE